MADVDFEFFEMVVEELSSRKKRVLTSRHFETRATSRPGGQPRNSSKSTIVDDLAEAHSESSSAKAIQRSVEFLTRHFNDRDARLPFTYKVKTGEFYVRDRAFLEFIEAARKMRAKALQGKAFEIAVMNRLFVRVRGTVHRVGHPRDVHLTIKACNAYLETLGFGTRTLRSSAGDGGFDLIWPLPFGAVPYRPLALLQCKNGRFDWPAADHSVTQCDRSMQQHRGLAQSAHLHFVMFNGYVTPEALPAEKMTYIPLGLSDLAKLKTLPTSIGI
jgi:hypothetical protein